MKKRHAFTLIELLVVIAIIGIVAALVVNMSGTAKTKQRLALVDINKNKLTMLIDNYQSKLNFYPPDNGNLATTPVANYDALAATNALLYELTGATNNANSANDILLFDGTFQSSGAFNNMFGRSAVNNASTDEPHNFFPNLQPKEYTNYLLSTFKGLLVPVPLSTAPNAPPNFWHYDSSTTNRHNPSSYDLWAEFISGSKNGVPIITTNGNW